MLRFVADDRLSDGKCRRREWLRIATLGSLGFSLPTLPAIAAVPREKQGPVGQVPGFGKARSVILVYASGGMSQLETWDPKPDAPPEIRGAFDSIPTSVPGTRVGEHMPMLAGLAHRYAIVRSVSHDDFDHGSATYLTLTGRPHPRKSSNPPPSPNDYPTYGALLKRVHPSDRFLHTAVHVNGPALVPTIVGPGQFGGFLGREYDPLLIGDVTTGTAPIPNLAPKPELSPMRRQSRASLLASIDTFRRRWEHDLPMADMQTQYRQAFEMLDRPQVREAFNLATESPGLRDRYGRHRSGQACLLARKLVEAEVPFVTVIWNHCNRGQDKEPTNTDVYGWDTHNDIFEALKVHLLPRFDESFSALLEDLDQRGLLDTTLLVLITEFGRAPRVALERRFAGSSPGRKHWASVYSVVFAGAGVVPGAVFGASDRIASHPSSDRVGPWDLAATMFSALGVDPATHYYDSTNRPNPLTIGSPITRLYQG